MSSGPRKVFDRGRRREDQTGGERRGGARSDGRFVPDKPVRARGTDGGDFCECARLRQAENPADGFAAARRGAFAAFSGACETEASLHRVSVWACTTARRRYCHCARVEETSDGAEKSGSGLSGTETALTANWGTGVAGDTEVAEASGEVKRPAVQSEARTENSGTCWGVSVTIFSGFAAAFTINGTPRYSSKRCFPAARRAAVPTSSGRAGTRRTIASADFSARNPEPLRTPHLRNARAKRKTPARARTLFRCSAESLENGPFFERGSAPRW